MLSRFVFVVFAGLCSAPVAVAQQFDRRSRDEPEVIVEAGGRVGPCDVLRFSQDGRFLIAGGDDKVARVWAHSASGLETDPEKMQILRWRAWREQRGGIKTLAVSADGKQVAVAGYGMKPSTVALIDRDTGETVAISWPRPRKGDANFGTVMMVTMDANGRIAFGTSDGSIWLWNPAKLKEPDKDGRTAAPPVRIAKHEPMEDDDGTTQFNHPRLLHFRDANTLLSLSQSGQVLECDCTQKVADTPAKAPPAKELFNVNDGQKRRARVYRAELIDGGNWLLIASVNNQVLLRSVDGKHTIAIVLAEGEFPRSIAWHTKTRQLAVGVGTALPTGNNPRFSSEGNDEIRVYDDPIKNPNAKPKIVKHTGAAEALAFHPTEQHLAIAGGDADEVTLRDLATPEKPLSVIRGAGRRAWAVNISERGNIVGIQSQRNAASINPNSRGAGEWTRFDLTRLKPTLDDSQPWTNPRTDADGWTIEPSDRDSFVWFAVHNANKLRYRLLLDRHRDQAPTCFCFLPATATQPTRVLIGHYYGCSLLTLDSKLAEDNALRATKVFTGHAGEVTSLVVAKDQSWFVTGGTDHTVAAWSLRDWASEPGLGAAFAEKDNRVVVTALDIGSPAWEAGLRVGDILDLLAVDGSPVYDLRDTTQPFGTVARAIESLKTPRPRIELFFGIAGTATTPRRDTLTTVRQRPLWKWLPAFDNQNRMNDWVVWMWHGSYYHTKTANGDRLAGWHMNHAEPGGRPQFYPLQQFEKHFHAPEVIESVLNTRDLKTALTKARGENPTLLSFTKFEPVPVRLALQHTDIRETGLSLTVTVTPRGNNPDLLPVRVELWLNEHRLQVWPATGEKLDAKQLFEAKVTIPANKFRSGTNTVTAIVVNAGGGHAEDGQRVTSNTATAKPKLLACFAGVNDYSETRKAKDTTTHLPDLKFANSDVEAFAKTIAPYSGEKKLYSLADIRTHTNANRKQLLDTLAEFATVAKPDDLLVFAFVGHTEAVAGRGPVLCLANYTRDTRDTTGVQAEELFDAIAKLNCRKIVLFDTMRATDSNIVRALTSRVPSPIVFGACEFGERSGEDATRGRGYFAAALLDSLESDKGYRKADYNLDGVISLDEWFEAATLAKQPRPPVCYPRELPKTAIWKR